MKKTFLIIGMGLCLSVVLLTECNSTRLVSSWKANDGYLPNYNKILVVGLMGKRDLDIRENVENKMVAALKAQGINAGSAYAEYGPKTFENLDEKTTLSKIRNSGYDGTLIIALLDKSKERRYTPGSVRYEPRTYYNRFWGYYQTIYTRLYEPGYSTVSTNYILEANFYNLTTGELEYSAQTKSFDPGSSKILASDFSKVIEEDMIKKGIIKQ